MKLYMHPVSTTSRPVVLFAAENDIPLDLEVVDLMTGANHQEPFASINPNRMVPVLEDGDFRLTESSAILKYLGDKVDSPAYPKDLRQRARVNEAMDWLNANLYRDFGYGLVYPQLFPHHKRPSEDAHAGAVAWGREGSRKWLRLLNDHWLGGGKPFLCGDEITLADYLGYGLISLGEVIHCDFSAYPNVASWIARMKGLKSVPKVDDAFAGWVESTRDTPFETV